MYRPLRYLNWAAFAVSGFLLSSCAAPEKIVVENPQRSIQERLVSIEQPTTDSIQAVSIQPIPEEQRTTKYAILISGSDEERDKLDLSLAYQILLENDFQRENIRIFDLRGKETQMYPVDGKATKNRIRKTLRALAKKVDEDDLLFVYITGHGDRVKSSEPQSIVQLSRACMSQSELKKALNQIREGRKIVLVDTCYGGGVAEAVSSDSCIGISGCRADVSVYGEVGDTFGSFFMRAYRDVDRSDLDSSGRVSVDEAFMYARQRRMESRRRWTEPTIYPSETEARSVYLK